MYHATSFIVVTVLLIFLVVHTTAQVIPSNYWVQPYQRVYDDDDGGVSVTSIGLCLASSAVAFKLGVIRGERDNENDGAAAFSTRECSLRALACGGVDNLDCIACFQLDITACTTINGCTASAGFCSFMCP